MKPVRFGSVSSGIEAASVAFSPLGWEAAWFSEIAKGPSAILAHHYPDVSNLGDMTTLPERISSGEVEAPDVLVGGTPCQAFSVAGLRQSLDDARGNLSLVFCEIANAIDAKRHADGEPECVVFWENVPGVLNTDDNAFGCILAGLSGEDDPVVPAGKKWSNAGCVFGPKRTVAWRVLDAQYTGVAQRRRRVFVVASAREGFRPHEALFEYQGLRRDTAPSREEAEDVAGTITTGSGSFTGQDARAGLLVAAFGGNRASGELDVSTALTAHHSHRLDFSSDTFVAYRVAGDGAAYEDQDVVSPLVTGTDQNSHVVAFVKGTNPHSADEAPTFRQTEVAACLNTWDERHNPPKHMVVSGSFVRRLTCTEKERLQGFPDGYTNVAGSTDAVRSKALGNSWAVTCVAWLGKRMDAMLRGVPA